MLVYKDGITIEILERDLGKYIEAGYTVVEEKPKEVEEKEVVKPKSKKK